MFDIRKIDELNNKIIECRFSSEKNDYFFLAIRDGVIFTYNGGGKEKFVASISDITSNKVWMSTMVNYTNIDKWYKYFALRIMFYINENKTYLTPFLDTIYCEDYTGLKFRLGIFDKDGNIEWVGKLSKTFKFEDWY